VDNIKIDLREIEWGCMDWTVLAQDRANLKAHEHSNKPSGSIKCREILE
jgi:hypothetical protein